MGGALIAMTTFRQRHFFNRLHEAGRIRISPPWRGILAPPPYRKNASVPYLTKETRILFRIAGIIAGLYACSSSVLAKIEEEGRHESGASNSITATLTHDSATILFINDFAYDEATEYSSHVDFSHEGLEAVLHGAEATA